MNNADVKSVNKSDVLKVIKQAQPVTRQYIVSKLGISSPTVSTIFDELKTCGIIRECGIQKSNGGRRSTLYEICPDAGVVISAELKNSSITLQVYDLLGEKKGSYVRDFTARDPVVDILNSFIEEVINDIKDSMNILGIGICLSGYISQRHEFIESKNLGIKRTKIDEFVKVPHKLKLVVEDKTRSAAYYKKWENALSGNLGSALFVDINTGIGASIIINNEIYRGFNDYAGEMGQIIIDEAKEGNGQSGMSGSLEALSSEKFIVEEVKRRIRNGEESCASDMRNGDIESIDIADILNAVEKQDALALDVMMKAVNHIFTALINVVRLFDPEKIYIMSSIALKENLYKLMNNVKKKELFDEIEDRIIFIDDSEIFLKGAASMVLGDVYENVDKYFELENHDQLQ